MGRVKKTLCGQLGLQLLKCSIKITDTVHGHRGAVKLIDAVTGIDGDLTHGDDFHAIIRPKTESNCISLKHDTFQRCRFILQREVMMTGGIDLVIADLAPDGDTVQQRIIVQSATDIFI